MHCNLIISIYLLIQSFNLFGQDVLKPDNDPLLLDFIKNGTLYKDSDGFKLEMGGEIYEFKYVNGELVYIYE